MTAADAERFAHEWIEAWNSHDLDRILGHYATGVEFTSPFVAELRGIANGTLYGIDEVRAYFARALSAFPDLRFELLHAAAGVSSVVLVYRSVRNLLAAETMILGDDGRAARVLCHYR